MKRKRSKNHRNKIKISNDLITSSIGTQKPGAVPNCEMVEESNARCDAVEDGCLGAGTMVKEMVEDVDSDGSGSIEFLEFLLLMGGILKDVPTDLDLRDAFTGELFLI